MGNNYDEKQRKIAAFKAEMHAFAVANGMKFSWAKRVEKQILAAAQERPVDEVIDKLRAIMKDIILTPQGGIPVLPEEMPPFEPDPLAKGDAQIIPFPRRH